MRGPTAVLLLSIALQVHAEGILLVTQEPVELRVGPAAHMPAMETLPAGFELLGMERSGGWYRVRADRSVQGWVPLLATRREVLPAPPDEILSTLNRERILSAQPRLEEAAALVLPVPDRVELQQFADSARLVPGRR